MGRSFKKLKCSTRQNFETKRKMKPSKCHFVQNWLQYLGNTVESTVRKPDEVKTIVIIFSLHRLSYAHYWSLRDTIPITSRSTQLLLLLWLALWWRKWGKVGFHGLKMRLDVFKSKKETDFQTVASCTEFLNKEFLYRLTQVKSGFGSTFSNVILMTRYIYVYF